MSGASGQYRPARGPVQAQTQPARARLTVKHDLALASGQGVLVVMPTYNEADNITAGLRGVLLACPRATVLVVDDDSPDGTGQIAEHLSQQEERVEVIHRQGPRGSGPPIWLVLLGG
ncbi:hypothetical protein KIM372_13370 [Bombiscardovia nodaiensis]|uniref:Glycosyltransferase 2-like domain-containing protein n=1 Tax=Bombiscardovia nodaiensis TaxID=2932181 RepID=A0ABN6SBA7_9BIFI|nr:hypothetical protein KIM372_13370 [Bombiscardovia nodaiensis]